MVVGLGTGRRNSRVIQGVQPPLRPRPSLRRHLVRMAAVTIGLGSVCLAGGVTASTEVATAATPVAHAALPVSLVWQQVLPDAGGPIAESSPSVATLDGSGPSVVVGDRDGYVWAFHLSNGSTTPGWPTNIGVPIDSTPSVWPNGTGTDDVYVDGGNASQPTVGGYYGIGPTGTQIWHDTAADNNGSTASGLTVSRHRQRGTNCGGTVTGPERVRLQRSDWSRRAGVAVLHG